MVEEARLRDSRHEHRALSALAPGGYLLQDLASQLQAQVRPSTLDERNPSKKSPDLCLYFLQGLLFVLINTHLFSQPSKTQMPPLSPSPSPPVHLIHS